MDKLCAQLCGADEADGDADSGPQQDVLLIGLPGSGKTLLAKRLQTVHQKAPTPVSPATVTTNGLELFSVPLPKGGPHKQLSIRELGGSMLPIWPKYYGNVHAVVFALDASDPAAVAPAVVELYELLQAEQLQAVPLCLALTKADLPATLSRAELDLVLGLDELERLYPGRLWVVAISALQTPQERPALREVVDWLVGTKGRAAAAAAAAAGPAPGPPQPGRRPGSAASKATPTAAPA